MYYSHNLRTNLQEWKSRLYKATYNQLGHQLNYFFSNIENEKSLNNLINQACLKYPYTKEQIEQISSNAERGRGTSFENQIDHAAYAYQQVKYLVESFGYSKFQNLGVFMKRDFEETKQKIVEDVISPIVYYFHDQLEKSNSVIYLLEKYKKRTEWFNKKALSESYDSVEKNYEQLFEDDLRLFLFDQGIDNPFSTPKSTSGRADIVGAIDTSDPIVIEIKIFDRKKGYGKNRIKEGFTQVVKYTNDFNKDFGYLVIFNLDSCELNFNFEESSRVFPPMYNYNNKRFFFIVVRVCF